ncbi:hypothetical protein [Parazoarcus communis]|uniref:Uncharacterized protein n=1 Tax=Parazoarcus communis SWub3 = DSM 12120 TaxID=1121029 RepID=A0A323USE2_9RHOO|nr:hypothetical protein [Parazoarcus communis]NMG71820.1 hypothetical protein [Parazoarcus communis SWub3 = DSM 12120]PZA14933.1 hypothetical protein DNK49_18995 [Azoarcus communis] [Parazoarcus communis SWub3 = DSM 12120]
MAFSYIRDVLDEMRIRRAEKKEINDHSRRIFELQNTAAADEDDAPPGVLGTGDWGAVQAAENWLAVIVTRHLSRRAAKLDVPMPSRDEPEMYRSMEWDYDNNETAFLTERGIFEVKARIREEEKHRREVFGFWVTTITGLLGATIGVLSLLISLIK